MPNPAWPSPFHAHSPSTLTKDSIIPSWTYSSPCCTRNPALFPVVIKASYQCTVESVWILTKYQLSFRLSLVPSCSLSLLHLSPVWNTPDFHSFHCHSIMSPRNPGPNDSSGIAHKLKPGPSVRVTSGTPSLPGPELVCPSYNVKGIPRD